MADEYAGRTTRTTGFKIREARDHEVMSDDPRAYVLEVIQGSLSSLHSLTERDIDALRLVAGLVVAGADLPVER